MATVHVSHQGSVAHFCGVSRAPTIVGVVSGRTVHYNEWIQRAQDVKKFVKSILPSHVMVKVRVGVAMWVWLSRGGTRSFQIGCHSSC